jgi:hypothetical protein
MPVSVSCVYNTGSTLAQTASAVIEMVRVGLVQVTWAGVQEARHDTKKSGIVQEAVHSRVCVSLQPVGPPLTAHVCTSQRFAMKFDVLGTNGTPATTSPRLQLMSALCPWGAPTDGHETLNDGTVQLLATQLAVRIRSHVQLAVWPGKPNATQVQLPPVMVPADVALQL